METLNLNIALKPNKKSEQKLLELSELVSKNNETNLEFRVDSKNFYFHLTLYQTVFPKESIEEIKKNLNKYSKEFSVFKFFVLDLVRVEQAIWLALTDTKEMKTVHNLTLNRFSDFRNNLVPEKYKVDGERFKEFSKSKQNMILKFGNPYVGTERSQPHITICEFREKTPDLVIKNTIKNLSFDLDEIIFDKVAIFESGEHGTCVKILHEVKLSEN